ncbi:hypothetical protein ACVWYN_003275 [Pedobacter sp. UYP24]
MYSLMYLAYKLLIPKYGDIIQDSEKLNRNLNKRAFKLLYKHLK